MKGLTLIQSPVRFVEDRAQGVHAYYMGFEELPGVTTILKAVIFREKYTGIDEEVLRNAALRGTAIHEAIQAVTRGLEPGCEFDADLMPYRDDAIEAARAWDRNPALCGKRSLAVEYLVSDCKTVATKIDLVEQAGEQEVDIADIKTTYELDEEYLAWQLSVEKYLTERQIPGLKVRKLLAYWYNRREKEWTVKEIPYKGDVEVERLLAAYANGEYWGLPEKETQEVPAPVMNLAQWWADLEQQIKELTAKKDEFRERLLGMMQEAGVDKVEAEGFVCSLIPETERKGFDYKRMIKENPELKDMFGEYETTSKVKATLRITLR